MTDNNYIPLPWQNEQWQYLQKRLQQQCLPHAILLNGVPGVGKSQFAKAFIQSLLCQQRDQQGYSCGICEYSVRRHGKHSLPTLRKFRSVQQRGLARCSPYGKQFEH